MIRSYARGVGSTVGKWRVKASAKGNLSEWLLALLTLRQGHAVHRSWLAGAPWPESSQNRALHNLRDDLVHLRKALGPESGRLQAPARDSLRLDLAGAAVDVLAFDAALQAGDEQSLRSAAALCTGPLLEGCLEE